MSNLGDAQIPYHVGGTEGPHSNVFQNTPIVTCPDFDYETWKAVATSGGSDVHFYAWDNGDAFRENGFGPAQSFRDIIDNKEGLFFFDTKDGAPPTDADSDGEFENPPRLALGVCTTSLMHGLFIANTQNSTQDSRQDSTLAIGNLGSSHRTLVTWLSS